MSILTKEKLINLLKQYNFQSKSVATFSQEYHVCQNTVTK